MNEEITKTTANKIGKAIDSIIDPLHQRISNPFIGSFLISWIIINWKSIVYLIFSGQSIENKFEVISNSFYGNEWYGIKNILLYFIFPLIISFLYLLLLPRLENIFDDLNKGPKIKKSDSVKDINLNILENRKAYAEKQAEIENIRADYMNVQGLNQRIETLDTELENRNSTIEQLKALTITQQAELNEQILISNENSIIQTENEHELKLIRKSALNMYNKLIQRDDSFSSPTEKDKTSDLISIVDTMFFGQNDIFKTMDKSFNSIPNFVISGTFKEFFDTDSVLKSLNSIPNKDFNIVQYYENSHDRITFLIRLFNTDDHIDVFNLIVTYLDNIEFDFRQLLQKVEN